MKYKKLIIVFAIVIILSFTLAIKMEDWEVLGNPNDDYLIGIQQMEMYLENDPENLHLKKNLAFNYLMQQDYMKARSLLEEIILEFNDDLDALHQLSLVYLRLNEYTLAQKTVEKLLEYNLHNSIAWINLAQINLLQNNYEDFNKNLNQAIQSSKVSSLEESEKSFYLGLEALFIQYKDLLNANQKYEAFKLLAEIEYFEQIFRIKCIEIALSEKDNGEINIIESKGFLELEVGRVPEAYETFLKLTKLYPEYEYGYYMVADTAFKLKDSEKLSQLQNSNYSDPMFVNFLESLIMFNNNSDLTAIKNIKELLISTETQYHSIFIFNLLYMEDQPDKELLNKFLTLDDKYVIAISFNKEFKTKLN